MSSSEHLVEECRLREEMDQKVGFVARRVSFVEASQMLYWYLLLLTLSVRCFAFVDFQIKEQKVAVDELSKLKKNRVGRRNWVLKV